MTDTPKPANPPTPEEIAALKASVAKDRWYFEHGEQPPDFEEALEPDEVINDNVDPDEAWLADLAEQSRRADEKYWQGQQHTNGHDHSAKPWVGPKIIDFAESLHIPTVPPTWLDDHRLLRKNTAFQFNGDGGIGKTEISLQMMIGMCATGTMFNLPVDRGPCLFVTFEEPENDIRWRIDHLCYAFNIQSADVKNLKILDLTRERDPWLFKEKDRQLVITDRWRWLLKEFDAIKPAFIALDNKARFFGANQNDAVLTTSYAHHIELACRDLDTTIMPLAHVSLSQLSSGRGDSGSVSAGNAFRSRLLFTHADTDREPGEEDDGKRKLIVMKANATKSGYSLDFEWDHGLNYLKCLYTPAKADDTIGQSDRAERVFLKLTILHNRQKIRVSASPRVHGMYAPQVFAGHPGSERVNVRAFRSAMGSLLESGKIEQVSYGYKSRGTVHLLAKGEINF
jgi:RecA-family ATPase